MNKLEKIEKILTQTNSKFQTLNLPQADIEAKLLELVKNNVTSGAGERYNLSQEIFKLKIYKFATISLTVIMIVLLSSVSVGYAADSAVPGDLLYPLDRQMEVVHIFITRKPEKLSNLHLQILQERANEWQKIKGKKDGQELAAWQRKSFEELQAAYNKSLEAFYIHDQKQPMVLPNMENLEQKLNKMEEMKIFIGQERKGDIVNALYKR